MRISEKRFDFWFWFAVCLCTLWAGAGLVLGITLWAQAEARHVESTKLNAMRPAVRNPAIPLTWELTNIHAL